MSLRQVVARWLVRADDAGHKIGWTPRWICEGAEVVYGYGPHAHGWDTYSRFAHWFERWLNKPGSIL